MMINATNIDTYFIGALFVSEKIICWWNAYLRIQVLERGAGRKVKYSFAMKIPE
jgi:hypothetical protein